MLRLALMLLLLFLLHPVKGISQNKKREDGKPQVPVCINYSWGLTAAPDSVMSFVATCFKLKGIELIDSSTMMELTRAEIGAVMQEYKKRNEPFPEFKEMSRKFRTAVNLVNLSIYRNFLIPGAPVDSIKWGVTAMPLNFEKLPRGGRYYPDEKTPDNLYNTLKAATDNIISFLGGKEENIP